jgi:pilus assembly protein CpaF
MDFQLTDNSTDARQILRIEGAPIIVGRDPDCTIQLRGPFIARKHAKIGLTGNSLYVENMSRSSLVVASRDVMPGKPARLDFGDEIQIGQFSLALVGADRTTSTEERHRKMQAKLVEFEQKAHVELIDRLNLRVTGAVKKDDKAFLDQIDIHLNLVLQKNAAELTEELMGQMVYNHLVRLVNAEVVRQCTGQVQTEYKQEVASEEDAPSERAIIELVSIMVDSMPLLFDPTSVQEDLATAEEAFDDVFESTLQQVSPRLKQYIVRRVVSKDLKDIMLGYGPLQDLLDMANITEIMVVGKDDIYIEKNGVIQRTTRSFFSNEMLMGVIERMLTPVGRRVDQSTPLVDARLLDGSRLNIIISPLSLQGPCITIRKFAWIPFTIDDLIERGSISEQCAQFVQGCVTGRKNVIISGGTGSGKTTLLNTLSAFARPSERIITIEESAELRLPQPHVVRLEGRPANIEGKGSYDIRDLVRNSLRMRPDRIIIGEVRGAECLDMLQAMNTGHDGSLSTLHANTPNDATKRMETMVLMAGMDMPIRAIREQIVSAVDMIVQIARFPDGARRITHISEVTEIDRETGVIRLEDIFVLRDPKQPRLRHTGYIPTFTEAMLDQGLIDVDLFL